MKYPAISCLLYTSIDTGDATSRNSRGSFNGLRIDCSPGAGNDAMCYGRNKGDNSPWSAKFFRD